MVISLSSMQTEGIFLASITFSISALSILSVPWSATYCLLSIAEPHSLTTTFQEIQQGQMEGLPPQFFHQIEDALV
jgi:hypothetical protein